MLFSEYPRAFAKLSWWQRTSYFAVGTYYASGACMAVYLLLPYLTLWFGVVPARVDVGEFVAAALPVVVLSALAHLFARRFVCDTAVERGLYVRGALLKVLAFPVFVLGVARALCGVLVRYLPTPKRSTGRISPVFLLPHAGLLLAFGATATFGPYLRLRQASVDDLWLDGELRALMLLFAAASAVLLAAGLSFALRRRTPLVRDAWELIPRASRPGGPT